MKVQQFTRNPDKSGSRRRHLRCASPVPQRGARPKATAAAPAVAQGEERRPPIQNLNIKLQAAITRIKNSTNGDLCLENALEHKKELLELGTPDELKKELGTHLYEAMIKKDDINELGSDHSKQSGSWSRLGLILGSLTMMMMTNSQDWSPPIKVAVYTVSMGILTLALMSRPST